MVEDMELSIPLSTLKEFVEGSDYYVSMITTDLETESIKFTERYRRFSLSFSLSLSLSFFLSLSLSLNLSIIFLRTILDTFMAERHEEWGQCANPWCKN